MPFSSPVKRYEAKNMNQALRRHCSKARTAPRGSRMWTQFNWGHDSVGMILIDFRGMQKGYLIASVGPLSWRIGGAEEQGGLWGQNSWLPAS